MNLWEKITSDLDTDETIVFPDQYVRNPKLYDKIVSTGYLIRGRKAGSEITWCADHTLERVLSSEDAEVLEKVLIVRLRLPWNETEFDWFISREELDVAEDDYTVINTVVEARNIETGETRIADKVDFEENRDKYEIVDIHYFVTWKPQITVVSGDDVHTYMGV